MRKKLYIIILCFYFLSALQSQSKIILDAETQNKIDKAKNYIGTRSGKAIQELNTVKKESQQNGNEKAQYSASYELALIYMNNTGEFDKVIKETYELEKYAKKIGDKYALADIYQMRGVSYLEVNFKDKGFEDLIVALQFLNQLSDNNNVLMKRAIIYNNISDYYSSNNDSYNKVLFKRKSYNETKKISEADKKSIQDKNLLLAFLNLQFGEVHESKKNIDSSRYYYNLAYKLFNNYGNEYTLYGKIATLKNLSNIYLKDKDYTSSIKYARKALNEQKNETSAELKRDLYLILQKSYFESKSEDSSRYYMTLYTNINDSIKHSSAISQNKAISNLIEIKNDENTSTIWKIVIISSSLLVIILIFVYLFFRHYNKKQKKHYQSLLEKFDNTPKKNNETEKNINPLESQNTSIHNDTLSEILNKLDNFEKSKGYLNSNVSLAQLATQLETNTKYLSQIINEYKGKNFSNYINALRIEYITKELYENPKYRKYKIASLAEIAGFASREVFTAIFKKETGMNPSFYLKNLEEDSKIS